MKHQIYLQGGLGYSFLFGSLFAISLMLDYCHCVLGSSCTHSIEGIFLSLDKLTEDLKTGSLV